MTGKRYYHWHHIVPRHMGGSDDPSNLVKLTIRQHALAHKKLWKEFGNINDYIAWKAISGNIGKEEIRRLAISAAVKPIMNTPEMKRKIALGRKVRTLLGRPHIQWSEGLTKNTDSRLKKISRITKQNQKEGRIHCIGDAMRGKRFNKKHKEKLKEIALNRSKYECPHCGKSVIKQMLVRWHGNNCKYKRETS